jgi:hypothetical protein
VSNDLKFFLVRLLLFLAISIEGALLFSIVGKAQLAPELRGHYFGLQIISIFLLMLLTIPLAIYYYFLKNQRWGNTSGKEQDQVDVETLALYSHTSYKERHFEEIKSVDQPELPVKY